MSVAFKDAYNMRRRKSPAIRGFENVQPPPMLYHYTTAAGLKGIIETGAMWFTNVAFFSDATELQYGLGQLGLAVSGMNNPDVELSFKELILSFHKEIENIFQFYATCFCKRGDLLNQWHGYSNRGDGCSIGFVGEELYQIIQGSGLNLCLVQYDPAIQLQLLRDEMLSALEALNEITLTHTTGKGERDSLVRLAIAHLFSRLTIAVAAMKDPVFQGEEEWRIICARGAESPSSEVQFRISSGLTVPFMEISLCYPKTKILPISEVIVGPTASLLAERGGKMLLQRHGMWEINGRPVAIKRSSVPLRSI